MGGQAGLEGADLPMVRGVGEAGEGARHSGAAALCEGLPGRSGRVM